MLQGTGSSVGKSRLAAGLCRVFAQDGFKVAPFKSQNMALNTYITSDSLEMGRAQAVQAEACGIKPSVMMNPVLLKPSTDKSSTVIVMGKVYKKLSAMDYHEEKPKLLTLIKDAYNKLAKGNDIIVIEGAGSPAEINLRDRDIVNMGMAELVDAPVILVGDIDKGGVFASIAGTMLLLTESERKRVKGTIINKFRGDIKLLEPGLLMLEDIISRPVLGVVPYTMDIYIDEEDSLTSEVTRLNARSSKDNPLDIKILSLPHITNFTDFAPLSSWPGVDLSYVELGKAIGNPDVLIIPGSENPILDLEIIKSYGWDKEICSLSKKDTIIVGISSGYHILADKIKVTIAGDKRTIKGLGLLDIDISLRLRKGATVVKGRIGSRHDAIYKVPISGFITYDADIISKGNNEALIYIENLNQYDGAISKDGKVIGTSVYGIFEDENFTHSFLKHIESLIFGGSKSFIRDFDYQNFRENQFDKWAQIVRENIDISKLYEIMGISK